MTTETQSQQDSATADIQAGKASAQPSRWKRMLKKYGVALFIFYTVKGLLWLIVPAVIAWWSMRGFSSLSE